MSNFFDAIGVADMEKVHSAVIGWMLSDKCEAFGKGRNGLIIRSELLQQIFGIKDDFEHFDSIDSILEWKDIDILIITSRDKKTKCWVIENKIKSSQHSNQLNRYVDTINCQYQLSSKAYNKICEIRDNKAEKPEVNEKKIEAFINGLSPKKKIINDFYSVDKHFCFLTLIKEQPLCTRAGVSWHNTSYGDLCGYLAKTLNPSKKATRKDQVFLDEYSRCINNLHLAIDDFTKHFSKYENVFLDGQKTKEQKIKQWNDSTYKTPEGQYARLISDNGLETIFQKCFLSTIIPSTSFNNLPYTIDETRGIALVDFHYCTSKDGRVKFGYQFQNGSFKVQILEKGLSGQEFYNKWYLKTKQLMGNKWTVNPSKKKSTPYLSISQKRDPRWFKGDLNVIVRKWGNAYYTCSAVMTTIIDHYNQQYF